MKKSKKFFKALKKADSNEHLSWAEAHELFSSGYIGSRQNLTDKGEKLLAEYDLAMAHLMYGRTIPMNLLSERAQRYADENPWIEYEKKTHMGEVVKDCYTLPEIPNIKLFDPIAANQAYHDVAESYPGLKGVLHKMAYGDPIHDVDPIVIKSTNYPECKSSLKKFIEELPKDKVKNEFLEGLKYDSVGEKLSEVKETHKKEAMKALAIPKEILNPPDNSHSTPEPSEAEVSAARSKLTDYLQTRWVADYKRDYVMSFRAELGEDMYITVHQDTYGRWFGGKNGPMGHEISIDTHDEPHEAAHEALKSIKERVLPKARALESLEVCEDMFE